MGLALLIFLAGTATYRFGEKTDEKSAFIRIGQCLLEHSRTGNYTFINIHGRRSFRNVASSRFPQFRFLNRALFHRGSKEEGRVSSPNRLKKPTVLRLAQYGLAVYVLQSFLLNFQPYSLNKESRWSSIGPNFEVPAPLTSFIT
ncbi:hypothetical protein R6Q59_010595 [Mikania micrantha]